jgi:hypothetical protein
MSEVPTVIVTLGALLFLTAIFGGGITMKEITIPAISRRLRLILFPLSLILMAFGVWIAFENPFQSLKGTVEPSLDGTTSAIPVPSATRETLPPASPTPASPLEIVEGFESIDPGVLQNNQDENGTAVSCTVDHNVSHIGDSSWWLHWEVVSDGYGICIRSFTDQGGLADWSRGRGVSFWYTSETADQSVVFWMHIGEPGTGYGVFLDTTVESTAGWVYVELPWDKFSPLPWEEQPQDVFDPSRLNSYGFTLLGTDQPVNLNLHVDDVALMMA